MTRSLTDRDHRIFSEMAQGAEYPEAHRIASRLLERASRRTTKLRGGEALRAEYVPPYDPEKYPNKWWKMVAGKPSRTLMAHLGKDGYSHIHYSQARVLSVREAARLQSFPDGYRFAGCMNSAFRQIGNAVPPLLAHCLGTALLKQLRHAVRETGPREPVARILVSLEA